MTLSEQLVEFAAGLSGSKLRPDVTRDLRQRILDIIGLTLIGRSHDFGQAAERAAANLGGTGDATVIGSMRRLTPAHAALANATAAHGLDFDDTHLRAITHVSSSVVPTALAMAERCSASGSEVLAAVAAGSEVKVRLGTALSAALIARGFHPSAVIGPFACAITAGKLAGLDSPQMVNALGIVGSQAAGILEYLGDGSSVKRMHPGWAALSGISAVELALAGIDGPREVFEGRYGFARTHLQGLDPDLSNVTADLGETWHLLDTSFKPYPSCHLNHTFISSSLDIRAAHSPDPGDIESIDCEIAEGEVPLVCEPMAAKRRPRSEYEAKFSLYYNVAAALVDGRVDVATFSPEAITRPEALALADRVTYRLDPASSYPDTWWGKVTVRMRDGRTHYAETLEPKGSRSNPMDPSDLRAKFDRNVELSGLGLDADLIAREVDALAERPDVSALMAACRTRADQDSRWLEAER